MSDTASICSLMVMKTELKMHERNSLIANPDDQPGYELEHRLEDGAEGSQQALQGLQKSGPEEVMDNGVPLEIIPALNAAQLQRLRWLIEYVDRSHVPYLWEIQGIVDELAKRRVLDLSEWTSQPDEELPADSLEDGTEDGPEPLSRGAKIKVLNAVTTSLQSGSATVGVPIEDDFCLYPEIPEDGDLTHLDNRKTSRTLARGIFWLGECVSRELEFSKLEEVQWPSPEHSGYDYTEVMREQSYSYVTDVLKAPRIRSVSLKLDLTTHSLWMESKNLPLSFHMEEMTTFGVLAKKFRENIESTFLDHPPAHCLEELKIVMSCIDEEDIGQVLGHCTSLRVFHLDICRSFDEFSHGLGFRGATIKDSLLPLCHQLEELSTICKYNEYYPTLRGHEVPQEPTLRSPLGSLVSFTKLRKLTSNFLLLLHVPENRTLDLVQALLPQIEEESLTMAENEPLCLNTKDCMEKDMDDLLSGWPEVFSQLRTMTVDREYFPSGLDF